MNKKLSGLLALMLAAVMLCGVLPMGVMAEENETGTPILLYMGEFKLDESDEWMTDFGVYPSYGDVDSSTGEYIYAEDFVEYAEAVTMYNDMRFGMGLVSYNLWYLPNLIDAEYDEGVTVPEPVWVTNLGTDYLFNYDSYKAAADELVKDQTAWTAGWIFCIEGVYDFVMVNPQPQNYDEDAANYFTVGAMYYQPGVYLEPAACYSLASVSEDDSSEDTFETEGKWVDVEDEYSQFDAEYQWYAVGEEKTTEITETVLYDEGYSCGEYDKEDAVWNSSVYADSEIHYVDVVFEVNAGDVILFEVSDEYVDVELLYDADQYYDEENSKFDFPYYVEWEEIAGNSIVAEKDSVVYLMLDSDDAFSAKITVSSCYTPVEGRTDKNLLMLNGEENLEGLVYQTAYACMVSYIPKLFMPVIPDISVEVGVYSVNNDLTQQLPSGDGDPVIGVPVVEPEVAAVRISDSVVFNIEPPKPEEKSVFTDFMKSYFYMKNTFRVYDFHNNGGDIVVTYPATGNMRIDVKCAITVEEGYEIADVLVDGVSVGAVEEYLFRGINKNHKIEAVFAPIAE